MLAQAVSPFCCMSGRDRTGMIALLLLSAVDTKPEEIVADYLETVRLGDVRAISSRGRNVEPDFESLCKSQGTSTGGCLSKRTGVVEFG